jgi:RNA polymerase sigma-70 factor (ECF subfamily)
LVDDDPPDEARVIARAQQGDAEAFDALVSKYLRRVVSIAFGIVRNAQDAEDLAQEAFVKAYQSIGRFRTGDPFGPWLFRIATNLSLDLLRRRRRFPHEGIGDDAPAARRDDAELPAWSNAIAARIDEAIEDLPEMQRLVARLHLVEELEQAEIATITGLSAGTVRSHLSLARTRLREKLADLYD